MSHITLEKATMMDADLLTDIMKKTFDEEAEKWLAGRNDVIDYNIQPPGYSSVEVTKYMINVLNYFKILFDQEVVGGIIVTLSGKSFARIDRIFVDPSYQGKGIGSTVITLVEKEFPHVRTWDLETSSRQLNNHHFYEKMGYRTTFETDEEFCYVKRIEVASEAENIVQNKDISGVQYEECNMAGTECYGVNLEGSAISNSNLSNSHISNCNLSHSTYQNVNLRHTLFADLNLSNSEMVFVTLGGVHFTDTNLGDERHPITFERCDLRGSQLSQCDLRNVEISESDVTGMKINNIPVEKLLEAYGQVNKK
ncbi:GNAT family N-acetyltransferase [Fictibacillus nanhaiensis]|uniref:GNAT family N-acetyltransferase n=1 Tax=Fictibacillus nanhaiensis TaxID=742169 RepID=UPI001C97367E|nr:GNAT family N-acetyltransferase [Fictibacillus nanhaiensis]MBY6036628.1 GNAT family N-acetyltransferase [Fictibacillus nanhaiensis]